MTESCSPSCKAKGGPTCQAPMTITDTSGSKDGPGTSREAPDYTTPPDNGSDSNGGLQSITHGLQTTIEGSEHNQEVACALQH